MTEAKSCLMSIVNDGWETCTPCSPRRRCGWRDTRSCRNSRSDACELKLGVVGRGGTSLLRLPIAAVVVGEEEEESRTVVRGEIETDVACLAWAWLLWRWLVAQVQRAVGRWRYLPKKAQGGGGLSRVDVSRSFLFGTDTATRSFDLFLTKRHPRWRRYRRASHSP
jgi:hypothetical protein